MHDQEHTPPGTRFAENLEAERDKLAHEIFAVADDLVARDEAEDHIAADLAALKEAQEAFQALANHTDTLNDPALRAELTAFGNAIESQTEKLLPQIMALAAQEEEIQTHAHQARERAITVTLSAKHQESITTQAEKFSQERQLLADFTAMTIKAAGSVQPPQGIDTPSQSSNEPLSVVIEDFCINQIGEGNWTPKTDAENRAIYALWLRIVGDQPISGYGYEHHRAYKAKLQRLPPNINKSPRYRDKNVQAILALGDKPAAPNTINKNLIRIAALFKWAVEYGYTTLNPASGMTIKNPKRASEERKAFSDDDLKKLFHSPDYIEGKHRLPYMHWTPLIALFTGARINEIAQLHLADFQEVEGIPVISINEEGEGKRLKTKAGKRLIPIHSELIRLGLVRHVEILRNQGKERLFPELKSRRDGYGQTVSKWFQRYRERCGITDEGKVFHSFRHTIIDRLKQAGIPKEKIAALVGHEDESVTFGRYGKDFAPAAMLLMLSSLDYEQISGILKTIKQQIGKGK